MVSNILKVHYIFLFLFYQKQVYQDSIGNAGLFSKNLCHHTLPLLLPEPSCN